MTRRSSPLLKVLGFLTYPEITKKLFLIFKILVVTVRDILTKQNPNMKERVDRHDDENIYQPKIHSDRIKELYAICQETHLPMTVVVDYALRSYYNAFIEEKEKQLEQAQIEAEMRMESQFEEDQEQRKLDDIDEWEDGSMYGF